MARKYMVCPDCGNEMILIDGEWHYRHNSDLDVEPERIYDLKIWQCGACGYTYEQDCREY